MSNHTPPRYWNHKGQARKWLADFISDTVDYELWSIDDVVNLCDEIFVVTRRGWRVMLVLREPFRRNPDALLAFVKRFLAKKREQS
jgi:hypothetical protein